MKVKDLIERLKGVDQEIEVVVHDWQDSNMLNIAQHIKTVIVKDHYNCFFRKDALKTGGFGGGEAFEHSYQKQIEKRLDKKVLLITAQ